jgi:hypothetical protein
MSLFGSIASNEAKFAFSPLPFHWEESGEEMVGKRQSANLTPRQNVGKC